MNRRSLLLGFGALLSAPNAAQAAARYPQNRDGKFTGVWLTSPYVTRAEIERRHIAEYYGVPLHVTRNVSPDGERGAWIEPGHRLRALQPITLGGRVFVPYSNGGSIDFRVEE